MRVYQAPPMLSIKVPSFKTPKVSTPRTKCILTTTSGSGTARNHPSHCQHVSFHNNWHPHKRKKHLPLHPFSAPTPNESHTTEAHHLPLHTPTSLRSLQSQHKIRCSEHLPRKSHLTVCPQTQTQTQTKGRSKPRLPAK